MVQPGLVPQEAATFSMALQKHNTRARPSQLDPDTPTDTGHTWTRRKGGMEFIPCCTAGAERLAEGLGDRSLERTEQAAERAAEPGLAVDSRGMWKGKRKGRYKERQGSGEGGKGKEQQS